MMKKEKEKKIGAHDVFCRPLLQDASALDYQLPFSCNPEPLCASVEEVKDDQRHRALTFSIRSFGFLFVNF